MLLRQRNQEKICLFRGVGEEGMFVYGGLGEGMFIYEGRGRKYVCLWGSGEKVYIHYNVYEGRRSRRGWGRCEWKGRV